MIQYQKRVFTIRIGLKFVTCLEKFEDAVEYEGSKKGVMDGFFRRFRFFATKPETNEQKNLFVFMNMLKRLFLGSLNEVPYKILQNI